QLVQEHLGGRRAGAVGRAVEGGREMDVGAAALAGALVRGQVVAVVTDRIVVVGLAPVGSPTLRGRVPTVGGRFVGVVQAPGLDVGLGPRRDADALGGAHLDFPQQA